MPLRRPLPTPRANDPASNGATILHEELILDGQGVATRNTTVQGATPTTPVTATISYAYTLVGNVVTLGNVLCGPGALAGSEATTFLGRLWEGFSFSVQTLATIGYGTLRPHGVAANLMVSLEALTGLLGFALRWRPGRSGSIRSAASVTRSSRASNARSVWPVSCCSRRPSGWTRRSRRRTVPASPRRARP